MTCLEERLEHPPRAVHVPRVRVEVRNPGVGRRELRGGQENGRLCARAVGEPEGSVEIYDVHLPRRDACAVDGRLARRCGEQVSGADVLNRADKGRGQQASTVANLGHTMCAMRLRCI